MYQTFQIDEQEEISQKPRNNPYQFSDKYSNFLKPNFIISVEDEYHEQVEPNRVSKQQISESQGSVGSNTYLQNAQSLGSHLNKQQEQFYEQKVGTQFQKKSGLKKIAQINHKKPQPEQKQQAKREEPNQMEQVQLKNNIKLSTKQNILFLYDDDQELVEQMRQSQDIHIPHRQIDQIFGLDSEVISQQEFMTITKTSQYFDTKDKETLLAQMITCVERFHCLKMVIKRESSGTNMFWPEYELKFHNEPAFCFAKRTTARPIATYLISLSANEFDESKSSYIGKIKTNIIGNILYVFGPGLNPKNAEVKGVNPRQMLATIVYQTSFMNQTKPRSFTVYVKHPEKSYFSLVGAKVGEEIGLDELFISSSENRQHIQIYQNSKPEWNTKVGGFILNFKGRVKQASVKNFILEDMNANEVMMFGKQAEHRFSIEVKDKLSPLVAFGIALSTFDSKFLCE